MNQPRNMHLPTPGNNRLLDQKPVNPQLHRSGVAPRAHSPTTVAAPITSPMRKPPPAPPAYRPQLQPATVQRSIANGVQNRKGPIAPPAYRPQPPSGTVQAMASGGSRPEVKIQPTAPAPYRPCPTPRVLQTKQALAAAAAPTVKVATGMTSRSHSPGSFPRGPQPHASRPVVQAAHAANERQSFGPGNNAGRRQQNPATIQPRQLLAHEQRNAVQRRVVGDPFARKVAAVPDAGLTRATARQTPAPVVQPQRRPAGGQMQSRAIQRALTYGWTFGGNTEANRMNAIFNDLTTLTADINDVWGHVNGGMPGQARRNLTKSKNDLAAAIAAQERTSILWKDRDTRETELAALRTEAHKLHVRLLAHSSVGAYDVRARTKAAFDRYAAALGRVRIGQAITHFASANNFGDVLEAAQRGGAPPAFMAAFVDLCRAQNWPIAKARAYFTEMNAGTPSPEDFTNSLRWLNEFMQAGNIGVTGNGVPKANYDGYDSAQPAGVALPNCTLRWDMRAGLFDAYDHREILITQGDLNHWKCGHTFEEFRLTNANATRAPFSSMWPRGTTDPTILADARAALASSKAAICGHFRAKNSDRQVLSAQQSGYTYSLGINHVSASNHTLYRLAQFFPTAGGNSSSVPKYVLKAIIKLFGP